MTSDQNSTWDYTSIDNGANLDKLKDRGYNYILFSGCVQRDIPPEEQKIMGDALACDAIPLIHPPTTMPHGYECHPIDSPKAYEMLTRDEEWYWVHNIYL